MQHSDICITGAGIIGLSLALELYRRGASVTVIERDSPLTQASQAAAGMLAAHDPDNPPEILPLSRLSLELYPSFLAEIVRLSGHQVPFQTSLTFQAVKHHVRQTQSLPAGLRSGSNHFLRLEEHSIDPRQLAPALLAAIGNTSIRLIENTSVRSVTTSSESLSIETTAGPLAAAQIVHTLGAWSIPPVVPRKGQMLTVRIPGGLALDYVVRTPEIYIVPRLHGPRAGQAVIGATVEDAGFTTHTDPASLAALRAAAARFLPALADEQAAPMLDHWAGLRPGTPDALPILGALPANPHQFLATGHYRNGILLAPATAHVLAALLAGETPAVPLDAFSPQRFATETEDRPPSPIFAHQP